MDWSKTEVAAYVALLVSFGSLAVAAISLWRSFDAARPKAWLELRPTTSPHLWEATIYLRNLSSLPIRLVSVSVPVKEMPVGRHQDFVLGVATATEVGPTTERAIKLPLPPSSPAIEPGQTGSYPIVFQRGQLSKISRVTLSIGVRSLEARPRDWRIAVQQAIPGTGVTIQLASSA